jgi:hypothetical protein
MKIIRNNIYSTINNLYEEIDNAKEERKVIDFDSEFDILMVTTTRLQIYEELLIIFKLLKRKNNKEEVLERTSKLTKKIKMHFSQLRKLKTKNYKDNVLYFTYALRVIYQLTFN